MQTTIPPRGEGEEQLEARDFTDSGRGRADTNVIGVVGPKLTTLKFVATTVAD